MTKTYTHTDIKGNILSFSDQTLSILHRVDGPAIEFANGDRYWCSNGELHRIGGPACQTADGTNTWWLHGRLHRIGGPAAEYANGKRYWYLNGLLHRTDGPAVEHADGTREWRLNGNNLTFSKWVAQTPVTDAERVMLALKYSEYFE